MERLNSKEFIEKVGISKWKLDTLEKEGIITPMRDGRIRYYNEEQVEQYNNYLIESIQVPEEEPNNQVVALIISEDKDKAGTNVIELLSYCNDNGIYIDNTLMYVTNNDSMDILESIFDKIRRGKVARILYNGDGEYTTILNTVCNENDVNYIDISPESPLYTITKVELQEKPCECGCNETGRKGIIAGILQILKSVIIGGK